MRKPIFNKEILVVAVVAVVSVVAVLYFRGTETQLQAEPSSEDGLKANSVSDSATSTADTSDKPNLPAAAESISDIPADPSMLTTDVIIEQMKQGNFGNVVFLREYMRQQLEWDRDESLTWEWVECYLNENDLKGLVWQQVSGSFDGRVKRVKFIFALSDDQVTCVWSNDGTRIIDFLSRNGNLIQNYGIYGTENTNTYTHYIFDDDFNLIRLYTLEIRLLEDWYEEQMRGMLKEEWDDDEKRESLLRQWGSNAKSLDEFIENYPKERIIAGEYYKRTNRTGKDTVEETLTKQQFLDAFEEMTGYSFYEVNPEGMYMRDDLEAGGGQSN